jgi:hypothetical protein
VGQDPDGNFSVSFGFGAMSFLQQSVGCDGSVLAQRGVRSKVISGTVEYFRGDAWRLSAFGGNATTRVLQCTVRDASGGVYCPFGAPFEGSFGGALLAYEARGAGIGVGFATTPAYRRERSPTGELSERPSHKTEPTIHARLGSRDRSYVQFDLVNLAAPGQVPMGILGVGAGGIYPGSTAQLFVGIGAAPLDNTDGENNYFLTGRITLPVLRHANVQISGIFGDNDLTSLSAGMRLHTFGARK